MTQRFFTCIALVLALTMLGGCGGKKSKKKAKGPDPAPVVEPETVDPNDGNPVMPEEPDGPDDGTPDGGDGGDGGDGTPGDGTPGDGDGGDGDGGEGGGGDNPFELPTGVVNPTDPIFPGDPQDPVDANEGGEVLFPNDEVATPEPATLLTAAMGATLLGMRRKRRLELK